VRRRELILSGAAAAAAGLGRAGALPVPARRTVRGLGDEERRFLGDFDAWLSAALRRFASVPALSVAVARRRGAIFAAGYGLADRARGVRADAHTGFYIASSTKSFVGLAFARLAEAGRIDLGWTLARLAPEVAFAPEVRAGEVTLEHLLSHSHGLVSAGIEFRLAYTGEHDPATLWRLLGRLRPNPKAPLGTFDYSNLGYNVAALLIERRLGRSWQALLEAEVLRPLGLAETIARGVAHSPVFLARPYAGERPLYLAKTDAIMQSAGGMYASAADMGHWLGCHLAAEEGGRPPAAAAMRRTHTPVVALDQSFGPFARTGYGLGWYSGGYRGATLYHAFGSYTGARAHTSFLPARDLAVAIFANDQEAGFQLVDIAAAYAYDWFLIGPEAAARAAGALLDRLADAAARQAAARTADRARRAARPWRLGLPRAAYRGRFCSDDYGTLTIGGDGERLEARMGLLRADLEPFVDPETARLELIPGEGEVLRFVVEGGAVAALRTPRGEFRRCG